MPVSKQWKGVVYLEVERGLSENNPTLYLEDKDGNPLGEMKISSIRFSLDNVEVEHEFVGHASVNVKFKKPVVCKIDSGRLRCEGE